MRYNLRDYQSELISNVSKAFESYSKLLVVAPCGSGKTIVASAIIDSEIKKGNKVWFIVHRKELLDQATSTFGDKAEVHMIQTLVRRLNKITDIPDLIIIDEAHHATSRSYMTVVERLSTTRVLGLTATPTRLSGAPLGELFEHMIVGTTANILTKLGFLAEYDYYAPKIDTDFTKAKIIAGDYKSSDIDFLMDKPKIYGDIISNYIKLALGKKTIIYCSSIDYSKKIEQLFNDNWFVTRQFDSNTPKVERDKIIQDFRDNKVQVLVNVDLVGEGFDVPDCECIILLRPTQSLALYIQQATRCLRPNDNKKAIIIDFVGNVYRHGMPTDDKEWSLTEKITCNNRNGLPDILVRQCTKCYKCYKGTNPICPYCGRDNGKTRPQIEEEQRLELEKIAELNKRTAKREQAMARDMDSLMELARRRGYSNPHFWAKMILKSRRR